MKTIWIVLISVVVTAGVIGGGTYYYFDNKATKDKNNLQAQIDDLNKQVADAEKKTLEDVQSTVNTNGSSSDTNNTNATSHAGMKLYNYSKIGLSFYYPESLGTPTLDEYKGNVGNGFSIYFTNNKDFRIGAITADFSADRGGAPWENHDIDYKNGQCSTYKDTKTSEYTYYVNCEIVTNENSLNTYYKESNFFDVPYSFGVIKVTKTGSPYKVINIALEKSDTSKKLVTDVLKTINIK